MLCELIHYRRDRESHSSVKKFNEDKVNYLYYMHKIEDVCRIVGNNGGEGAVVLLACETE
jgi:hypothetical protein